MAITRLDFFEFVTRTTYGHLEKDNPSNILVNLDLETPVSGFVLDLVLLHRHLNTLTYTHTSKVLQCLCPVMYPAIGVLAIL